MSRYFIRLHNGPRLLLCCLALASLLLPFVTQAPNRLLSGQPHAAPDVGLLLCLTLLFAWLSIVRAGRHAESAILAVAGIDLVTTVVQAGTAADALAAHAPAAARTMLGAGFWALAFCVALIGVDAFQRSRAPSWLALPIVGLLAGCVLWMAAGGRFQHLSLVQEAVSHGAAFATALLRHLLLVGATLTLAVALGVPLGLMVQRRRPWRKPVFFVLNIVQTVPSVALFGLLIAPLAAIGLSGIGLVPALAALVLYALLPVVRGVVAGLDGVDPATREAAAGMGLAPAQILWRVDLPLAAPALVAALRIVTVQTIGLAVVAALIGAGGLGDFVFQGLGQYAVDLVLLGALPAIALALLSDLVLRLAAAPLEARLA